MDESVKQALNTLTMVCWVVGAIALANTLVLVYLISVFNMLRSSITTLFELYKDRPCSEHDKKLVELATNLKNLEGQVERNRMRGEDVHQGDQRRMDRVSDRDDVSLQDR